MLNGVSPEILAAIESNADHFGLSVDDYLRSILLSGEEDISLKAPNEDEFEADMKNFAREADKSGYCGSYALEDTYSGHD